jgi:hypothetical protein
VNLLSRRDKDFVTSMQENTNIDKSKRELYRTLNKLASFTLCAVHAYTFYP